MATRGRPRLGEMPLSSTERSRRTRRREAARVRALELFADHIRREVGILGITSVNLTESQKELAFVAYGMSQWLNERLANLGDAADFFKLDANGHPPQKT